jgi:hypothetical protein
VKGFVVLSGTGIKDRREWVPTATAALQLVRTYMKLRRPGVRIEDDRGNPVSFVDLKEIAERKSGTEAQQLKPHPKP